jgi:hypothetical protein
VRFLASSVYDSGDEESESAMLTWKLWYALQRPPVRNPLFQRAYVAPEQPIPWYIGLTQWIGILFALPIIAFAAMIYGIGWSVGISNLIGKERAQGTFDLISLAPSGPLGMSWAIATGYLYHHQTFRNIHKPSLLYWRVFLVASVFAVVDLSTELTRASLDGRIFTAPVVLFMGTRMVTLALALYIDHLQSTVLTLLVGMSVPLTTPSRMQAQLFAFAVYMGAQITSYLLMFVIGFSLVPSLFALLGIHGWLAELFVLALRLLVLVGSREGFMLLLWNALAEQINADRKEVDGLVRRPQRSVSPS